MYNSLVIANYFVGKSIETGVELTPMKLLKLVYISHGWFMGYNETPLISDAVLAWKYGPVIRPVYSNFKKYCKSQILSPIDINGDFSISEGEEKTDCNDVNKFLDVVWDKYKNYSGIDLSALTHQQGSPWHQTVMNLGVESVIPNGVIRGYYKKKVGVTD
jgi:uncharacterized phage-associated protein